MTRRCLVGVNCIVQQVTRLPEDQETFQQTTESQLTLFEVINQNELFLVWPPEYELPGYLSFIKQPRLSLSTPRYVPGLLSETHTGAVSGARPTRLSRREASRGAVIEQIGCVTSMVEFGGFIYQFGRQSLCQVAKRSMAGRASVPSANPGSDGLPCTKTVAYHARSSLSA
jgi:hypothetical protein